MGTNIATGSDGRNRLHKNPPPNHPAAQEAQAGVPASVSERKKLINEGEQNLDRDTGAANAHGQGGINPSINY
jgi:hypothetical protein